jgi:hypothetical protein
MTAAPHVFIGGNVRPSEALRRIAPRVPVCVVTHRLLADLEAELGSARRAARFLVKLATRTNKPVMVNGPTETGSRTMVIPPKAWSEEKVLGWIGGHHETFEAELGPVSSIRRAG